MIKEALVHKSSLRTLERSTHGGLITGDIGIIAAYQGSGKTACLVHIAMDQLFQERNVIHISFSTKTSRTESWYEDIFSKISNQNNLENAIEIHDEILKHRVIMNFNQDGVHMPEVERSVRCLIERSGFSADYLVIDGYDFTISSKDELKELRVFAEELNLSVWFTASLEGEHHSKSIPQELEIFESEVAVIVSLEQQADHVHLNILKDHDNDPTYDSHLKLDSKTLLIAKEDNVV